MKANNNATPPSFRFFLWNDMHIEAPRYFDPHSQSWLDAPHSVIGANYPFANEKAEWALECASGKHGFEKPSFIVSAGDIIVGEVGMAKMRGDFACAGSSILNRLEAPFAFCGDRVYFGVHRLVSVPIETVTGKILQAGGTP